MKDSFKINIKKTVKKLNIKEEAYYMDEMNHNLLILLNKINIQQINDQTTFEPMIDDLKDLKDLKDQKYPEQLNLLAKIPLVFLREFYEEIEYAFFDIMFKGISKTCQKDLPLIKLKIKLKHNSHELTKEFVDDLKNLLKKCAIRFWNTRLGFFDYHLLSDLLSFDHLYKKNNDDNSFMPFKEKVANAFSIHLIEYSIKLMQIFDVYKILSKLFDIAPKDSSQSKDSPND